MATEKLKFNKGAVINEPGSTKKYKTGDWRTFKPSIDNSKCIKCRICVNGCPHVCFEEK